MPALKTEKPSDLEMQILGVLWRDGPATARAVLGAMPDRKKRAYTSVLSAMQVMEKKGLLSRSREGLTDRWRPAVTQSRVFGPFLRRLVANVFGGKPTQVMQHLLEETEVGVDELAAIRHLLDTYENAAARGRQTKGERS